MTANEKNISFPLVTQFLCITFGLIGFILSASSASGCDYFTVVIPLLFYLKEPWRFSAGLFKYNLQTSAGWSLGCVAYPSAIQSQSLGLLDGGNISSSSSYTDAIKGVLSNDPSVKAASALGAVSAIISGLAFISSTLMLFLKFPRGAFNTLGAIYFLCFTTQLLTFLVFNNQVCNGDLNKSIASVYDKTAGISCDLSKDAYLAISAAVFFLGLGILITICPTPEKSVSQALCGSCSCCSDEQQGQQIHPHEDDGEKKNTGDISGVQGTPSFSYSV